MLDERDLVEEMEVERFDPKPELDEYLKRVATARAREAAIIKWHTDLFLATEGRIELPWAHDSTYCHPGVSEYKYNEDKGLYETVYDHEKSLAKLAEIAKFASKQDGVTVEKKYVDNNFVLHVIIKHGDRDIVIEYTVSRQVICERKVVGTKVVPAYTSPERIEEVVEWDCKPVSLLGFDPSNTDNEVNDTE